MEHKWSPQAPGTLPGASPCWGPKMPQKDPNFCTVVLEIAEQCKGEGSLDLLGDKVSSTASFARHPPTNYCTICVAALARGWHIWVSWSMLTPDPGVRQGPPFKQQHRPVAKTSLSCLVFFFFFAVMVAWGGSFASADLGHDDRTLLQGGKGVIDHATCLACQKRKGCVAQWSNMDCTFSEKEAGGVFKTNNRTTASRHKTTIVSLACFSPLSAFLGCVCACKDIM